MFKFTLKTGHAKIIELPSLCLNGGSGGINMPLAFAYKDYSCCLHKEVYIIYSFMLIFIDMKNENT